MAMPGHLKLGSLDHFIIVKKFVVSTLTKGKYQMLFACSLDSY